MKGVYLGFGCCFFRLNFAQMSLCDTRLLLKSSPAVSSDLSSAEYAFAVVFQKGLVVLLGSFFPVSDLSTKKSRTRSTKRTPNSLEEKKRRATPQAKGIITRSLSPNCRAHVPDLPSALYLYPRRTTHALSALKLALFRLF